MISTPAIGVRMGRAWRKVCPKAVAVAPRVTKTTEKPRMKNSEVKATRRCSAAAPLSSARNWSKLAPLI
ncbi:hypothetical protein D3C85_1898780 [compost metagenome]